MSPYHVLIIPAWYPKSPADTAGVFIRDQAMLLKARGHTPGILYPNMRSIRELTWKSLKNGLFKTTRMDDSGTPVYILDGYNMLPRTRFNTTCWTGRMRLLFDRYISTYGHPDLIHAHCILYAGALAVDIGKTHGIPIVVTEHSSAFAEGLVGKNLKPFVRNVIDRSAALVAVSPALAGALSAFTGRNLPCHIIANIIDTDFFSPGVADPSWRIVDDGVQFVNVASHTPVKCLDTLIRAFAARYSEINAGLLLIGGGPLTGELKSLVNRLGVEKRVRFGGAQPRNEVLHALRTSNVFVLSSFYETFGVAAAEAMAVGKPVVSTNVGGLPWLVEESSGVLVPFGDEAALGNALVDMAKNREKYNGESIRQRCVDRFSGEIVGGKLEDLYREVLGH